jgi:hypothetical protein
MLNVSMNMENVLHDLLKVYVDVVNVIWDMIHVSLDMYNRAWYSHPGHDKCPSCHGKVCLYMTKVSQHMIKASMDMAMSPMI